MADSTKGLLAKELGILFANELSTTKLANNLGFGLVVWGFFGNSTE